MGTHQVTCAGDLSAEKAVVIVCHSSRALGKPSAVVPSTSLFASQKRACMRSSLPVARAVCVDLSGALHTE